MLEICYHVNTNSPVVVSRSGAAQRIRGCTRSQLIWTRCLFLSLSATRRWPPGRTTESSDPLTEALFLRACLARPCLASSLSVRHGEWIGYGPPCLPARSFLSAGPQQKAYCGLVGHRLYTIRALHQSAQRSPRLYYQQPTVSRSCPPPTRHSLFFPCQFFISAPDASCSPLSAVLTLCKQRTEKEMFGDALARPD